MAPTAVVALLRELFVLLLDAGAKEAGGATAGEDVVKAVPTQRSASEAKPVRTSL